MGRIRRMGLEYHGSGDRVGECNRCGQCCRHVAWLSMLADDAWIEYIAVHDADNLMIVEGRDIGEAELTNVQVAIHQDCVHLVSPSEGTWACNIQGNKPEICRVYPVPGTTKFEGCGFSFVEPESNRDGQDG